LGDIGFFLFNPTIMRLTAASAMIKNNVVGRMLNSSTAVVGVEVGVCVGWLWFTP
jgi:hypothetical protein